MAKKQNSDSGLGGRLKRLVEVVHDGNMNEAARDIGVAQPTIRRIIEGGDDGKGYNPRIDVVRAIADHYGVPTDWLLTGTGEEPMILREATVVPLAEQRRWASLVNGLGLPNPLSYTLWARGADMLTLWNLDGAPEFPARNEDASRRYVEVQRHAYRMWIEAFRLLRDQLGDDGLRAYLERNSVALSIDLGVASELVRQEVVTAKDVAGAVESLHLRTGFTAETSAERAGRKAPARKKR